MTHIHSSLPRVAQGIHTLYAHHEVEQDGDFADFQVEIASGDGLRRWLRPQARFSADGRMPFAPLPCDQAFALFEWALNWQIASSFHEYLIIHASVVEKAGRAVIMPAPPGSGKSTLCAALVTRGWRLLSDELALVDAKDGVLIPIPRPVNLKNESINVIADFAPDAWIGEIVHNTAKGTVAYMKPPPESIERSREPAVPRRIVFPRFEHNSGVFVEERPKGRAFMQIAENAVNYSVLGLRGFEVLSDVVDRCECFDLRYSVLEDAIKVLEEHRASGQAHSADCS